MKKPKLESRIYLVNVVEKSDDGLVRESIWYGGNPENLALFIIDVMSDWYDKCKDTLDKKIVDFHKWLEKKGNVTFKNIQDAGFKANGMTMHIEATNNFDEMYGFLVREICNIFGKNGEKPEDFPTSKSFKDYFKAQYDIDQEFIDALEAPNEGTLSKAFLFIDIRYNYSKRHYYRVEK